MIPVVVPVKPLASALQRLRPVLNEQERRALQAAMLSDVLSAASTFSPRIVVVTNDPAVADLGGTFGARIAPDHVPAAGINAAVARGLAAVQADQALVVMGDLPNATAADLSLVALAASERSVALAVSRDGTGTNAMYLAPPDIIAPSFGLGSLERHLVAAQHADCDASVVTAPGLMLDVDTPEDLAVLVRTGPDSHTRRLCRTLEVEARVAALA